MTVIEHWVAFCFSTDLGHAYVMRTVGRMMLSFAKRYTDDNNSVKLLCSTCCRAIAARRTALSPTLRAPPRAATCMGAWDTHGARMGHKLDKANIPLSGPHARLNASTDGNSSSSEIANACGCWTRWANTPVLALDAACSDHGATSPTSHKHRAQHPFSPPPFPLPS